MHKTALTHATRYTRVFAMLCLLVLSGTLWAHGDVHDRIIAVTAQIERNPDDPELYVKRAELYRSHRKFEEAHADLARVAVLDPERVELDFYRGRLRQEAEQPERAVELLTRFLAAREKHPEALLIRSRALRALGQNVPAATDLNTALTVIDPPTPEVYLERAQAWVAAGEEHVDTALAGIDEGIAQLGPIVTLIQYAAGVEQQRGRPKAAIAFLDKLPENVGTTPRWLARRVELLIDSGDLDLARAVLEQAKQRAARLPRGRPDVRTIERLDKRLRE